jgi:NAD kinase
LFEAKRVKNLLTSGTQIPQAVVDGGDDGTVLRMADLGEENGARELSQRVSETDEESTTKVHCKESIRAA